MWTAPDATTLIWDDIYDLEAWLHCHYAGTREGDPPWVRQLKQLVLDYWMMQAGWPTRLYLLRPDGYIYHRDGVSPEGEWSPAFLDLLEILDRPRWPSRP